MGLSELDFAVRDYCLILWRIECGDLTADEDRQIKHNEIAEILECNKESLTPVLHNIDYTKRDGYHWLSAAQSLIKLKNQKLL